MMPWDHAFHFHCASRSSPSTRETAARGYSSPETRTRVRLLGPCSRRVGWKTDLLAVTAEFGVPWEPGTFRLRGNADRGEPSGDSQNRQSKASRIRSPRLPGCISVHRQYNRSPVAVSRLRCSCLGPGFHNVHVGRIGSHARRRLATTAGYRRGLLLPQFLNTAAAQAGNRPRRPTRRG